MKNRLMIFSYFIVLTILFNHCSTHNKSATKSLTPSSSVEDFDEFYNRFHKDSLFQLSRIKFPLKGMNVDGFDHVKWTKENWSLMKTRIYDVDTAQFKTSYKKTDNLFIQKYWLENTGYFGEYRFEVIGNKWFLVYALNQNN